MNPVYVKRKTLLWWLMILFALILLIGAIVLMIIVNTDNRCTSIKWLFLCMPIALFIYYRIWSKILLRIIDCMTCRCAEHGWGYAIFHYCIWSTIGHPFLLFVIYIIETGLIIYNIWTRNTNSGNDYCIDLSSSDDEKWWKYGYTALYSIFVFVIFIGGCIVSIRNHRDVKFQLNWKNENQQSRENAINDVMHRNSTLTYIYGSNRDVLRIQSNAVDENLGNELAIERIFHNDGRRPSTEIMMRANSSEEPIPNEINHGGNFSAEDSELRRVVRQSVLSARDEEKERAQYEIELVLQRKRLEEEAKDHFDEFPDRNASAQRSVSVKGFWAKASNLSSGILGNMFKTMDVECIVCYEDYAIGQRICVLKCGHKFHQHCAVEWLTENPTCPLCRTNVLRGGL